MSYFRAIRTIAGKDLRLEFRRRENLTLMGFFTLVILVIFHFSLDFSQLRFEAVGAGVIWIAVNFAGILALGNSFRQERDEDCLQGLRLTPVDPSAIYLGKLAANLVLLVLLELFLVPLIGFLFNYPLGSIWFPIMIVMLFHTVGFSALGTLFAAITAQTRRGETLLPLLIFPVEIPLIVSATRSTMTILKGGSLADVTRWLALTAAFNLLILAAAVVLFEYILEDS